MAYMRRRYRALVSASAVLFAALAGFSCSSSSDSDDDDDDGGEAGEQGQSGSGGRAGATSAGGANSGGTNSGGSAGSSGGTITVAGNTSGGSGGSGAATCAGEVTDAKRVPLDIYLMLDSSASMLDLASGTTSKWTAVTNALATFLQDPESEGIGVGLQFFPLRDPDAPETCNSNAECGEFGPCFQNFCENAGPGIFACAGASDCLTDDGEDAGPCVPLRYCWSNATSANPELILCHNDQDCDGGVDDCVVFAECSGNTDYTCRSVGVGCVSEDGEAIGTCQAFDPTSFCIHDSACGGDVYAAPDVEIATLPDALPDLGAAITAHEPDGNTPTSAALEGAISHASTWAEAHPDHRVIVLLATDGLPTECLSDADPTGIADVQRIAAAGVDADPSITTYVVGVFAAADTDARANLNDIAEAGGSETAFLVDATGNVEEEFLAALAAIRGTGLTCEFQIPEPVAGTTLDYALVNVEFSSGGSTESLFYVAGESECDASGGWYYDVLPSEGTPTKIMVCPSSCERFKGATDGSVEIRLGCQTLVR
jgi:hypothetical protein